MHGHGEPQSAGIAHFARTQMQQVADLCGVPFARTASCLHELFQIASLQPVVALPSSVSRIKQA